MSLPPIHLPLAQRTHDDRGMGDGPFEDPLPSVARFLVRVRVQRSPQLFRSRNEDTLTPCSYGMVRISVLAAVGDVAPGLETIARDEAIERFRDAWWAMEDGFPPLTQPMDLTFDFDQSWVVQCPPGDRHPWVGTFDDRDWYEAPDDAMRMVRSQLRTAMEGQQPEAEPPEWPRTDHLRGITQEDCDWPDSSQEGVDDSQ